jgi:phosphatidylglycerophosphate synthase
MIVGVEKQRRVNNGLLAGVERRALVWMARRLPGWVNSDHLTILALLSMAAAGAAFWAARFWTPALLFVIGALALNWFGDSLDGTLARVRGHERPRYGYYVDHVLDVTGISLLLAGLALSGFMTPIVALLFLVAYLLVSAEVFLATAVHGEFRMSFLSVGPTELRVILSTGTLMLFNGPHVQPLGLGPFLLFDVGGVVAVIGLAVAFATSVIRNTAVLYRAEPLPPAAPRDARSLHRPAGVVPLALAALLISAGAGAATLQQPTIDAWNAYVSAVEARIDHELGSASGFLVQDFAPDNRETRARVLGGDVAVVGIEATGAGNRRVEVPEGMVHHWRGSVFVPGVSLEALLSRLQHPSELGPHQEDVLALRVLGRRPDALRLFIRMTRTKIVTVTYDTEHDVTYRRFSPRRAASRSIATRIVEVDHARMPGEREKPEGSDRGFMWRLNSYWRYEQVDGGVIVELESVTLSRDVPFGLRALVRPLIDRVARESMGRTLENLRRTHAPATSAGRALSPSGRPAA